MRHTTRLRGLLALLTVLAAAIAIAACGSDDGTSTEADSTGSDSGNLIVENLDNNGVKLTIGSRNFTEQFILGEIYSQALEAAGYDVSTDLNLGSEQVALKALEDGEISGYPEYTSTALTSFFDTPPEDVPSDAQEAVDQAQPDFEKLGLTAFTPTPFADANAVGLLTSTADDLGVSTISDLEGKSQDLTLAGSPSAGSGSTAWPGSRSTTGCSSRSSRRSTSACATRSSTRATPTCRSCSRVTRSCSSTATSTRCSRTTRACFRPAT